MFLVLVGVNVAELELFNLFQNLRLDVGEYKYNTLYIRNDVLLLAVSFLTSTKDSLNETNGILTLRRSSANSSKSSKLTSTVGIS